MERNILKPALVLVFIILSLVELKAQDSLQIKQQVKRSVIALHFFYNDFITAQRIGETSIGNVIKNNRWGNFGNMQGGFGLDYMKGITRRIDFVSHLNASWVDYLRPDNTLYDSNHLLFDIGAGAHLKMFPENYAVNPFLIAKANYSLYKNISGISLIPGAGLQFFLFRESCVLLTTEYRAALGKKISDQLYYSVGIATAFGKAKTKKPVVVPPPPVPEPVKQEVINTAKNFVISVIDEATGQSLPYVDITIAGPGGKNFTGITDANGKAIFNSMPPAEYIVKGVLNNINTSAGNILKSNFIPDNSSIEIILTHNDPRFTLSGVVINKTIDKPEGGAEVKVTNETLKSISNVRSHAGDGLFRSQLEAESDFTVIGKKAEFISNIERISTKGLNRSATLYVRLELAIEEAKVGQTIVLNNIYFETNKSIIRTEFSSDIEKLVQFLRDNPATKLEIRGHTDNTGSYASNIRLSQQRAESVVTFLSNNGIDRSRLLAKGYGPSEPVTDNSSPEGRSKNRRVEMKVLQ